MTPPLRLRLVCHPPSRPEHTPLHADTDRMQLWELVNDQEVHLILRAPGLMELARRRDAGVIDYCENLLESDNSEEWFLGVKTIAELGTQEGIDRLVMIYAASLDEKRRYIMHLIAKTLTTENVHPFSIMVRGLTTSGEVDITGWTSTAVATLQDVCKRMGVETVTNGITQSPANRLLEPESELVDASILSK